MTGNFFKYSAVGCLMVAPMAHAFKPVSHQLRDPEAANVAIFSHVIEPRALSPRDMVERVKLPQGFEISLFAEDLINPRMLDIAGDGTVYVTRRSVGDVVMLRDTNSDGVADVQETVARRPGMHGIAIDGSTMYLATVREIYKTTIEADGNLTPLELIVDDLPDGGQHPNRTLRIGPDDKLYVSVGSSCNACPETNPEHATMLQMNKDGSNRIIFASGLRNTVGFDFEPASGEMWSMDHGIDWLGDNEQHEELNHIVKGNKYGWPYVYDNSKLNPKGAPPEDITHQEWAETSVEPAGFYTPHAAPMQMGFYTGTQFPEAYRGDAFIAMRGSWNRKPPSGYEIVRVHFDGGRPTAFSAFATGFLERKKHGWAHRGRLAGLAQAADGALLVTDDTNGVIYRIAYTGQQAGSGRAPKPTNAFGAHIRVSGADDVGVRGENVEALAMDTVQSVGQEPLNVSSAAFANGGPIPEIFSAYGEDISPPLQWEPGPDGTESYALIMEDPDAPVNPPFVHWIIYNIPGPVHKLPEGIPTAPQLPLPAGALQGQNDRGSIGYFGPMPPPDDPAHSYHFQVFALDTVLDIPAGATRDELLEAMEGHILSVGSVAGEFAR